jgi:Co/Zn/Cd efflux system component
MIKTGSIAVVVVGLTLHFAPHWKGGRYLDPALSLLIVALLLLGSVPLCMSLATFTLYRILYSSVFPTLSLSLFAHFLTRLL